MTDATKVPKPPEGYATWLDLALETPQRDGETPWKGWELARQELSALRAQADAAVANEAEIRANEREVILRAALDVHNRHAAANLMGCRCPDCMKSRSFAVRIGDLYCRLNDFREHGGQKP